MLVKNKKTNEVLYFEEYINAYSEKEYIDTLLNDDFLEGISYYYPRRYIDDPKIVDVLDIKCILFKESLDHYIAKRIKEDERFIYGNLFKRYINYISKIGQEDPTEYITNIVFHNEEIKDKIFEIYFKKSIQVLNKIENNTSSRFEQIFNRIVNGEEIAQNEIDFVSSFLACMKFDVDAASDELLKYIFGPMRNTNLKFSQPVQEFVLSRLPFIYSSYKLDGCRIDVATHSKLKQLQGAGVSQNAQQNCIINRDEYKDVSLKNINDSFMHRKDTGTDFTHFIIVAFHELTHQYQSIKSKDGDLNDVGISIIISRCLRSYLKDYNKHGNHDNSAFEIDADKYGWTESLNFYKKYLSGPDKDILINNCEKNIQTCTDRRALACKCNPVTMQYSLCEDYDVTNMYVLVNKKPELLNKIPMLKHIFKYSYETNKCSFNLDLLFENNFNNDNIMEFIDYYFVFNKYDALTKYIKETSPDMTKIVFLISNFVKFVEIQHNAPYQIDDIIKRNNLGDASQKKFYENKDAERIKRIRNQKYLISLRETLRLLKHLTYTYPQLNDFFAGAFMQLQNASGLSKEEFEDIAKRI